MLKLFLFLSLNLSLLGLSNNTETQKDGIETDIVQCGTVPGGGWDCYAYTIDDGIDCGIGWVEGQGSWCTCCD